MALLSSTQLILALGGSVVLAAYVGFILIPAVGSYGRVWERVAAGFLSLFILATLLVLGLAAGAAIFWFYANVG